MENPNQTRIYCETALIDQIKTAYPELQRMTNTGIVHWALTKALKQKEVEA